VMVDLVISISAYSSEESNGDTIEIGVDVIHPEPDTPAIFPVSTIVVRLVEHGEALQDVIEAERITLRVRVRSLEVIKTRFHNIVREEREARARIECHLGLVQEELGQSRMSHRHKRESFRRLEYFMISHHGYRP
nr:hypothetical protein [Tanacetum cinerariifolium]GEX29326.1 hypothetical protein [Tanacetum cinerariifolium]